MRNAASRKRAIILSNRANVIFRLVIRILFGITSSILENESISKWKKKHILRILGLSYHGHFALIWMFIASDTNKLRTFRFEIVMISNRPLLSKCKPFICRCFQDAQIISVSHIWHKWNKPHSVMLSEIACGRFELFRHKRGPCSHAQCTWTTISICFRARFGFHMR